jgi:NDP-sugar pyrophosphorylase family protein
MAVKGMILAAGYGSRLAALTQHRPKALIPVADVPMIQYAVEYLERAGCSELIVNVHHHAEQIAEYFQHNDAPVHILHEPILLGTGGGVLNAAPLLQDEDVFLLYNADIVTEADLELLLQPHRETKEHASLLATLLVQHRKSSRPLLFDENMQFLGKKAWIHDTRTLPGDVRLLGFCGVHAISGKLFRLGFANGFSDIFDIYRHGMRKGFTLQGVLSEAYWTDLGTPERIAKHEMYLESTARDG